MAFPLRIDRGGSAPPNSSSLRTPSPEGRFSCQLDYHSLSPFLSLTSLITILHCWKLIKFKSRSFEHCERFNQTNQFLTYGIGVICFLIDRYKIHLKDLLDKVSDDIGLRSCWFPYYKILPLEVALIPFLLLAPLLWEMLKWKGVFR